MTSFGVNDGAAKGAEAVAQGERSSVFLDLQRLHLVAVARPAGERATQYQSPGVPAHQVKHVWIERSVPQLKEKQLFDFLRSRLHPRCDFSLERIDRL